MATALVVEKTELYCVQSPDQKHYGENELNRRGKRFDFFRVGKKQSMISPYQITFQRLCH